MPSFNSRARKGRDEVLDELEKYYQFQFTRPQGARHKKVETYAYYLLFQFRRPQGARPKSRSSMIHMFGFQFTRPQGARQGYFTCILCLWCFNSRARKGRDFITGSHKGKVLVSIHAPARGATCFQSLPAFFAEFQFTRPQGARPYQQ